jgi:CRP-like cAMP-binding protein
MDDGIIEFLNGLSLFRGLPREVVAAVALDVQPRHLNTDDVLFRKGDPGDALYMIRSGRVKITTVDSQGKELMLNQCGPGEAIGEMSLIDSSPRSASVVALEPAEILVLKREAFLDELGRHPTLAMDVMRNISGRLRFATTYIEKAIEWSQRIAEGDYSFALQQIQTNQSSMAGQRAPDEARAAELLSAFFRLVEGVKKREEALQQQVRELKIQIDETKRKQEVESLTSSDFFSRLKAKSEELRRQRAESEEEE